MLGNKFIIEHFNAHLDLYKQPSLASLCFMKFLLVEPLGNKVTGTLI